MITIHASKKLLAKLPLDDKGFLPTHSNTKWLNQQPRHSENPLSGWHANLVILQRRNCVLFVHDQTRFPLFIPGLTKPYFERLDWWFVDVFMNTLLKVGGTEEHVEIAHHYLSPLRFDTSCDRSVQGTMNQMKGDTEYMLTYRDIDVVDLSAARAGAWLADRPCTIKGQEDCIWPDKAMIQLLESLSDTLLNTEAADNVVSLDKYR